MFRNNTQSTVSWLLRIGVAFAFLYPAIAGFINPIAWVGYFPQFVRDAVPFEEGTLLLIFGVIEIVIALWILSGKKIFIPSVIATVSLTLIVILNWGVMDVVFRDISIAAMAAALAIMYCPLGWRAQRDQVSQDTA
jgi:hypothetical protein|tara:strand:- start:27574 stop:27981 length:408 start_codon:yes stop_codon:yes gene_type:complete